MGIQDIRRRGRRYPHLLILLADLDTVTLKRSYDGIFQLITI
jgi:hypothetical protein